MRHPRPVLPVFGLLAWLGLWLCRPNVLFDGHPVSAVLGMTCLALVAQRSLAAAGAVLFAAHAAILAWIVTDMWATMGPALSTLAWITASGYATVFCWLALAAARQAAGRGDRWIFFLPPAWVLCEVLRAEAPYGFDWPSLGYASAGSSLAMWLGSLGVHGMSGLIVAIGCWLASVVSGARARPPGPTLIREAACVAVLLGVSSFLPYGAGDETPLRVALIQAGDADLSWAELLPDAILQQVDLVVGPEGLMRDPEVAPFRGAALIAGATCPLHVACRANRIEQRDADGALIVTRNKAVLVPWYEVGVFEGLWPRPIPIRSLRVAGTPVAVAICYEIAHSGSTRAMMADSPALLINPTSDLWQDSDLAARQQAAIAQARAAELGVPVIRVSNRYHSSIYSPAGDTMFSTGPAISRAVHILGVPPTTSKTLRGRFPGCMEVLLAAGSLLFAMFVRAAAKPGFGRVGDRDMAQLRSSIH